MLAVRCVPVLSCNVIEQIQFKNNLILSVDDVKIQQKQYYFRSKEFVWS